MLRQMRIIYKEGKKVRHKQQVRLGQDPELSQPHAIQASFMVRVCDNCKYNFYNMLIEISSS